MSKKEPATNVIAEETTTLPEGAHVSVYKTRTVYKRGTVSTGLRLQATFDKKIVKMKVEDGISAANLKVYLGLIVREITRRRGMLSTKPVMSYPHPQTINEFVLSMAFNGMFMLDDATGTTETL